MSQFINRVIQPLCSHTGTLGSIVSTLGCAACFPAAGALAASLGLGFLASFEGIFINTLLPVFAVLAALSQLGGYFVHRQPLRLLSGLLGPAMVLATLYLFWVDSWSTEMLYAGLIIMLLVSLLDIFKPATQHCPACETGNRS